MKKKKKLTMITGIVLTVFIAMGAGLYAFLTQPSFGKQPTGKRLERIRRSPNYREGMFQNQIPTPTMTGNRSRWQAMWEFVFGSREGLRPTTPLPVVHTDLRQLPLDQNLMVWFGHSSYLLQIEGLRILVDPVFCSAAPVSFVNKPFAGTDIFKPDDMPDIDLLVITHDHWDHLDYQTVKALQGRVKRVVCPLGVGAHLEYWGYSPEQLIELDWWEQTRYKSLALHCLPARHFSGRGLTANQTLWGSFLIESPSLTLYLGGDGGYGPHFAQIGSQFPHIDWAILENGQYNTDWKFIHTLPFQLQQIVRDLHSSHIVTVHHSKYALARHPWDEPLKNAEVLRSQCHATVATPSVGEPVILATKQL